MWYNKLCFPEFAATDQGFNPVPLIGLLICVWYFVLILASAVEQVLLQRDGKQVDNNYMVINILLNTGKYFLLTGATQPDPCDAFLTNQSIRGAKEWGFHQWT